jgi:hypothetical protein
MNYTVCVREFGLKHKPIPVSKPFDSLEEANNFAMTIMLEEKHRSKIFYIQKNNEEPILWVDYCKSA